MPTGLGTNLRQGDAKTVSHRVPITLTAHWVQIEPLKGRNWKTICLFLVQGARWSERSMAEGRWVPLPPSIQSPFVFGVFEELTQLLGARGQ